jgi:hypothetical protein
MLYSRTIILYNIFMERSFGNHQDAERLREDGERVGGYLSAALKEIATFLGGEEFAAKITDIARIAGTTWPNPDALRVLNELYPGSAEQVMSRAEVIQQEIHEHELADIHPNDTA